MEHGHRHHRNIKAKTYLSPDRWNHKISRLSRVIDKAAQKIALLAQTPSPQQSETECLSTYPIAASEIFTRGRSKSSRRRRFSSVSLLSLRSAMLCFFVRICTGSPPALISYAG